METASYFRSMNCLDSEQYMNIQHNLLFKTWTAGLRGWWWWWWRRIRLL